MANPSSFVVEAQNEMRAIRDLVFETEERAARLLRRYQRLGYNSFTDKHFYVDGDTAGALRDDLDYSKDEFSTAIGNLSQISGIVSDPVLETLVKVTG